MSLGQSRVVGFFAVCCLLALMNAIRGLVEGTTNSLSFSVAQRVFILLTGSALELVSIEKNWLVRQDVRAGFEIRFELK